MPVESAECQEITAGLGSAVHGWHSPLLAAHLGGRNKEEQQCASSRSMSVRNFSQTKAPSFGRSDSA